MPPSRAIARARRAVARSGRTVGRANRHVLLLHARLSLIKFLKLLCRGLDNGILLCCFEHHILFCLFKKSIDSSHIDFICGLTLRSGRCAKPSGVVFLRFRGNNGPGHLLLVFRLMFCHIKCLGYSKGKGQFPFFLLCFGSWPRPHKALSAKPSLAARRAARRASFSACLCASSASSF